MTQPKHTPGPWHIGETNPNFGPKVYDAQGNFISDVASARSDRIGNDIANAHLIAAAPELLEACEALLRLTPPENAPYVFKNQNGENEPSFELMHAILLANKAIFKARQSDGGAE